MIGNPNFEALARRIARPVRLVPQRATRVRTNGRYVRQEPAMPIEPVDILNRRSVHDEQSEVHLVSWP